MRAMEKENKKLTDEAKKEYNETIRSLVSHIKKKDPRCIAQREKQQELERERQAAEKRRKEEHRRKRAEYVIIRISSGLINSLIRMYTFFLSLTGLTESREE